MTDIPLTLKERAATISSLGLDRLGLLAHAIDQTASIGGEIWECGTWRGGTALWMQAHLIEHGVNRTLRVFDTFTGLATSGPHDVHPVGAMAVSRDEVEKLLSGYPNIMIHEGVMPATFSGLGEREPISVAHLDVDQYESIRYCLPWLYDRLHEGGYLIIDDYGCPSCPGARRAVDEFMKGKPEVLRPAGGDNPQAHFIKV